MNASTFGELRALNGLGVGVRLRMSDGGMRGESGGGGEGKWAAMEGIER